MARVPNKHDRDHHLEPVKLKNASSNGRPRKTKEIGSANSHKIGVVGVDRSNMGKSTSVNHPSTRIARDNDAVSLILSRFMADKSYVNHHSEKVLGNDFFKQGNYEEAIECYSRSLALKPTGGVYANRAMAYLKLKRFQEAEDDCTEALNHHRQYRQDLLDSRPSTAKELGKPKDSKEVQQLAARAATLATAEAAKNIAPPTSAYQFEASWGGFYGDPTLQARLLKATGPVALPQIFKNALPALLLIDIVRCVGTFFTDETELAVRYLENLTKVPRFNTIIMRLSPEDKSDLQRIWDDVFCNKEVAPEILQQLRLKYCC